MARREPMSEADPSRAAFSDLEHRVVDLLASQRRLTWRSKKASGATTPDRLRALHVISEAGETTHSELVRRAQLNPASVSALLEELEQRKLVRRRQDKNDGRVWWVALTAKGRAESQRLHAIWDEQFEKHLGDLSDDEIETACLVFDRLIEVFDGIERPD
jgi:DNA-binding MarR family transcriptional regulator